jgi:glutamyl-tRNA synthetase
MLTRFAPSPTGYIHIGNVRTALMCYLYAKKSGGKFMLRIDDTDVERSKEEYVTAIKADLEWLGLKPDLEMRQSARFARYAEVVEDLKKKGRIYACYETQDELEFKRKIQLGRGMPPVYDRSSLKLTEDEKKKFEAEGRKPHLRFLLDNSDIEWNDEIRGNIKMNPSNMSDPIVIRENGEYTYMLPSTVDDVDMKVTNIIRGEDHISNTAIQIQIFKAMGAEVPKFAHSSLIKTKEGKLSKREGKGAVAELREMGIQAMAINSFLAKIGTSDPVQLKNNLDELVAEFDINKFGKAPTMYDFEDIQRLNTKALHEIDFDEVKNRLPAGMTKDFWNVVRINVENIDDAGLWWKICHENIDANIASEDKDYLQDAAKLLPNSLDEKAWDVWVSELKAKSGRKGKALFMPLRIALTGMEHGPELKNLLPLMGRDVILKRLAA